jgi:hypothetical protein
MQSEKILKKYFFKRNIDSIFLFIARDLATTTKACLENS